MQVAAKLNLTEGFDNQNLKRVVPSWLISLVLPGLMFAFLMFGFHRRGLPDGDANSHAEFRDAGIVLKSDFAQGTSDTRLPEQSASDVTAEATATQNSTPVLVPELPQDNDNLAVTRPLLDLPATQTIGATHQLPLDVPTGGGKRPPSRTQAKGRIHSVGPAGSGAGPGQLKGTSFFQIAADGDHFCYVVDCSASMDGGAMGLARAELMASIERLDSAKQFQIFFYNSEIYPMTNGKQDLFYATEINRTFARQFINNQQPENSTLHKPALLMALRQSPDVIFFLTDGDIPEIRPDDLQDLKRQNRNNTQIHVIEFGKHVKLGPMNWLERLAKDHNGTYRYRDVDALRRE
jgi:hypothetical protein